MPVGNEPVVLSFWVATFFYQLGLLRKSVSKVTPVNSLDPRYVFFATVIEEQFNFSLIIRINFPHQYKNIILHLLVQWQKKPSTYIGAAEASISWELYVTWWKQSPLSTRTSKLTGPRGPAKSKQKCLQWIVRCINERCYSRVYLLVPDPCILTTG